MTALLENLADGVVPADAAHLGEALEQAERLGALVADLLQLSRLEAGVVELERQPVHLRALADDCVAQVRSAGRTAAYDVAVPADLTVSADPARLRQLLVNALDNAGRHSPPDAPVLVDGRFGWRRLVAGRLGRRPRSHTGRPRARLRTLRHRRGGRHRPGPRRRPVGGAAAWRNPPVRRPARRHRSPAASRGAADTAGPELVPCPVQPPGGRHDQWTHGARRGRGATTAPDRRGRALRPVLAGVGAGLWPAYGRGRRRGGSVRRSQPCRSPRSESPGRSSSLPAVQPRC